LNGLHIPVYEGTGGSGWDAVVEAPAGTRHIPFGTSVWEMGRDQDVEKKANDDFMKRTANPLHINPATTTFVFVTPRHWPKARSWAQNRRSEGKWQDVRAYDADDLLDWFDEAPTAQVRAMRILGLDPTGTVGIAEAWSAWSTRTAPAFPAALLTAGRERQSKALLSLSFYLR
jgi:hypothetical protein